MIVMELKADARHFVALCGTTQFRAAQSVARGQYVTREPRIEIKIKKNKSGDRRPKRFSKLMSSLVTQTYIALLWAR